MKPLVIHATAQHHVTTPFCGDLIEVLRGESPIPDLAVLEDLKPTEGHYHRGFHEIYLVLDGEISLRLYDPSSGTESRERLGKHEVCVIPPGVHHKVDSTSEGTRMCVVTVPKFDREDEKASDRLR